MDTNLPCTTTNHNDCRLRDEHLRHYLPRRRTYRVRHLLDLEAPRRNPSRTRDHPADVFTGDIRSHTSGKPPTKVDDHLVPYEHPPLIRDNLRQPLLNHNPTITRANVDRMTLAKETCTIHSPEFQGVSAIVAFRIFRASAILTLYRHLLAVKHRQHNITATSVDLLSQATQNLLQAMDSVQPAGDWKMDERPNTMVFTPTEINYNTLRQHAQPYVFVL